MDKEAIGKRIQQLVATKQQFLANAHACDGAIEDCQYWLAVIAQAETKKSGDTPGGSFTVVEGKPSPTEDEK